MNGPGVRLCPLLYTVEPLIKGTPYCTYPGKDFLPQTILTAERGNFPIQDNYGQNLLVLSCP